MKDSAKTIGAIVIVGFILLSWFFNFFGLIFYIIGLYMALYFISLLFRTTSIIDFISGAGAIILVTSIAIADLYILYLVLRFMFESNFVLGLILMIFGLPIVTLIFYIVGMGVGLVLGGPLIWFRQDLERRFPQS